MVWVLPFRFAFENKIRFQIMVEKSKNMDDNDNYLEVRIAASPWECLRCRVRCAVVSDFREKTIHIAVINTNLITDHLIVFQLSKMNFSPFTTSFANVNVNQFAKFTQNLATPSQVRPT